MPITLNGTTGVVTPGATVGSITGVLKATSGVVSQAIIGTDYSDLTLATAQTASGTAVDFTGIPSWAKRVTVIFDGVSLSGTSVFLIQIGDSGGIETTGYNSVGIQSTISAGVGGGTSTSGFVFGSSINSASNVFGGIFMLSTLNSGTTWAGFGGFSGGDRLLTSAGSKTLSADIDRIRITTVNGTDTFDAGTINISYE